MLFRHGTRRSCEFRLYSRVGNSNILSVGLIGKYSGDSHRHVFHQALPIPNESFDSMEFIALYVHIFQQLTFIRSTSSISQFEVISHSSRAYVHTTSAMSLPNHASFRFAVSALPFCFCF